MSEKEISYDDLENALVDIEKSIESWRFYIKNGADLGSFCNEVDELRGSTEYFLKLINDFCDQEILKEMDYLRNNF